MRIRRMAAVGIAVVALTTAAAACGDDDDETTSEAPATSAAAPAETSAAAPASSAAETLEIAYLSASSANTWLQASLTKMEEIAAARGAKITEFDAQFKPEEQTKQLQDVIAAGKYDGIIVSAINGVGLIPDLQAAMDAGMEVAVLNQVVGDKLDTPDPQVDGITTSVLAPPLRSGQR